MGRITSLIPLVLLLIFVAVFAWIGWEMYLYSQGLADRGTQHMAKKNISFNKDGGMKVGVKEMSAEEYAAKTQGHLVNAWNLSSWPAYKSRFWNKEAQAQQEPLKKTSSNTGSTSARSASSASKR